MTTIYGAATDPDGVKMKVLVIAFIEIADVFLLAIVLYIIGLGLCELFVGEIPGLPGWLVFGSLDDLKTQLIGAVVVVIAVFFLGRVLQEGAGSELLLVGGGLGVVIAALALFLKVKHEESVLAVGLLADDERKAPSLFAGGGRIVDSSDERPQEASCRRLLHQRSPRRDPRSQRS